MKKLIWDEHWRHRSADGYEPGQCWIHDKRFSASRSVFLESLPFHSAIRILRQWIRDNEVHIAAVVHDAKSGVQQFFGPVDCRWHEIGNQCDVDKFGRLETGTANMDCLTNLRRQFSGRIHFCSSILEWIVARMHTYMSLFDIFAIRVQIQCFWLQDIVKVTVFAALNKCVQDCVPILQNRNRI